MTDVKKKARRGFAAMSPEKQREIASLGGKAAHEKGTAHEFTPAEAKAAGRRGGQSRAKKRQERAEASCGQEPGSSSSRSS